MDYMLTVSLVLSVMVSVSGHGRLLDPPSRSSLWRFGLSPVTNYNDNQLSCGGFANQHLYHHGKCGVCGDPYQGPRDNEAGGKYARGIIARRYVEGQTIDLVVEVTALHHGYFEFRICPNNNVSRPVTQDCLDKHLLVLSSHSTRFSDVTATGRYTFQAQLPVGLTCSQCVVQWKWHTGNNFGYASDGHSCIGCGPQEEFYGCADVAIISRTTPISSSHSDTPRPVVITRPPPIVTRPPPIVTRPPPIVTRPPMKTTTLSKISAGFPINIFPGVPTNAASTTTTTKTVMTTSDRPASGCRAINLWVGNPVLDQWCISNCARGNCPPSACACS
ncbi:uncharacterized protein LOC125661528 [Ostrea edulis]|uniref:uncharacterized protein LOC125661528 n=1 Tax=Ostrea edulis TaxID=37623 RepID=UPI0024AF0BB4|nr:uncharacterized protein LOC125661528 [Ostrea edulis]